MLTTLYQQLCRLLTEAGFSVHAHDAVPPDAALPFVTLRIEPPLTLHGSGSVTLTCWLRSDSPHADRLAAADALIRFVPPCGLTIPFDSGLAVLFRADGPSVSYPESRNALGAAIRHDLLVLGAHDQGGETDA